MSVRYYLRDENLDATCDAAAPADSYDLNRSPGAALGVVWNSVPATTFGRVFAFDLDVSADSPSGGTHTVHAFLACNTLSQTIVIRHRLVAISAGCSDLSVSDWSPDRELDLSDGAVEITDSLDLDPWPGSGDRLRLEIWARRTVTTGSLPSAGLAQLGNSYVDAPWSGIPPGPPALPARSSPHQDARALLYLGNAPPRPSRPHLKPGDAEKRLAARPRYADPHRLHELAAALGAHRFTFPPLLRPGDDKPPAPQHRPVRRPIPHEDERALVARTWRPAPPRALLKPDPAAPTPGGLAPRRSVDRRLLQRLLQLLATPRRPERRRIGGDAPVPATSTERHRVNSPGLAYLDRPFEGEGLSVYATVGQRVLYRALRILGGGWIKGQGGNHDVAAVSVLKTTRRAQAAGTSGDTLAPTVDLTTIAGAAGQHLAVDARHYRDDVEHEHEDSLDRPLRVPLDGSLDEQQQILGRAQLLEVQPRAGGIVRLRFRWLPAADGLQPDLFRALATAGPSTPAQVTISAGSGGLYSIDTPHLLDSAAYTYTIQAENLDRSVTAALLEDINVPADASGPPAVSQVRTQGR